MREPQAKDQRSRQADFNEALPFFDWYYVYVRDVQTRRAWAFTYSMSRCGTADATRDCKYEGAWPGVAVMQPGKPSANYVERFPLDAWSASTSRQEARIVAARSNLSIAATTDDGSHIHLTGRMASRAHAWRDQGGLGSQPIEWDLRVTRRAGWFGESWVETPFHLGRLTGAIMWSPYGHMSTVEGTLRIGGERIVLGGDEGRWRAYADSNWGVTMPRPPRGADPVLFPWGWYYAASPHADPAKDASLICGIGRTDMKLVGVVYGKLCDIRIGDALRLSLWSWAFERAGNRTASWASDGGMQSVEAFDVTRGEWAHWRDEYGSARVPMRQSLAIRTKQHEVAIAFSANANATSRLLFPLQDELFSDFEALGATATVRVVERKSGKVLADFTDQMGGLEFGYRVPISSRE